MSTIATVSQQFTHMKLAVDDSVAVPRAVCDSAPLCLPAYRSAAWPSRRAARCAMLPSFAPICKGLASGCAGSIFWRVATSSRKKDSCHQSDTPSNFGLPPWLLEITMQFWVWIGRPLRMKSRKLTKEWPCNGILTRIPTMLTKPLRNSKK